MRIVILSLVILLSLSCSKNECTRTVKNMTLFSSVTITNFEKASVVPNYYHSEFQTGNLSFTVEFLHSGAGDFCEYSWGNYPLEETIEISCNKTIEIEGVEILPNNSLIELFDITKTETEGFFIAFLLKQKTNISSSIPKQYYTFTLNLTTENGELMEDSCVVKFQ